MSKLMRRICSTLLLATAVTSGVVSCGFHLRGQVKLDDRFLPVTVKDSGVNAEIKPRLVRSLNESNIPVVENDQASRLHIIVKDVEFEKHLVSSASGENSATIDTYDIGVKLSYKFVLDGKDILNWQDLRINRILQFSNNAVVSSATEEATLHDDLLADAVNQIITRLRFINNITPKDSDESKG